MSISLDASLRTCKVDTAWATRVQSDRFENPDEMSCPVWTGFDLAGRQVSPDSFYTKSAGCNSALDRVEVENDLRPQYAEYINLSASGIDASVYGNFDNNMNWTERGKTQKELQNANNITGNFGLNFGADVYPSCGYYPYKQGMNQVQRAEGHAPTYPPGAEGYNHYKEGMMYGSKEGMMHGSNGMQGMMNGCNSMQYVKRAEEHTPTYPSDFNENYAVPNTYAQSFQRGSQNFRQQGAMQNGFVNNQFRQASGF